MSFLFRLAIVIFAAAGIQGCKSGATWQTHEKSPAGFAGQSADHYFLSVAVDWHEGGFDDLNTKTVRIYLADDRLGSSGLRVGELLRDSWEVDAGSIVPEFDWEDDVVTVQIVDDPASKLLLTKRIRIDGTTATLIAPITNPQQPAEQVEDTDAE